MKLLNHRENTHFNGYCQTMFPSGYTRLTLPPATCETSYVYWLFSRGPFQISCLFGYWVFLFFLLICICLYSGYESFVAYTCCKYLLLSSLLFYSFWWCFDEQKFISLSFSVSNFFIMVNSSYIPFKKSVSKSCRCVCISVLQRNRNNNICTYTYTYIYRPI